MSQSRDHLSPRQSVAASPPRYHGGLASRTFPSLPDDRVRPGLALEPRPILPFERSVVPFAVAQTPLVSGRPEERVPARTFHGIDATFQSVLGRIRRKILGRHPRCHTFPAPEGDDQRHAFEVLGPIFLEPRLDALGLPQPLASKSHLSRSLPQPVRQVIALCQGLRAPRLLQGPRLVDCRCVAPIGRCFSP